MFVFVFLCDERVVCAVKSSFDHLFAATYINHSDLFVLWFVVVVVVFVDRVLSNFITLFVVLFRLFCVCVCVLLIEIQTIFKYST